MKKRKKLIANILLLVVIFSIQIGIFVYGKYIATICGKGDISIARWNITVNNETEKLESISLGEKTYENSSISPQKLAPGTRGCIELTLNAEETDTAVDYEVNLINLENKPTNLYFTYKDDTKYYDVTELNKIIKGRIDPNSIEYVQIYWIWPYTTGEGYEIEANDQIDTSESKAWRNFKFDVVVKGLQAEPELVKI